MSKTHKTNAARSAWKKLKNAVRRQPPNYAPSDETFAAMTEIRFVGTRYGNKRKAEAKAKVTARRAERKRNNRIETDD